MNCGIATGWGCASSWVSVAIGAVVHEGVVETAPAAKEREKNTSRRLLNVLSRRGASITASLCDALIIGGERELYSNSRVVRPTACIITRNYCSLRDFYEMIFYN